jgi:DNA-binding NarL/FixJ family response regulator
MLLFCLLKKGGQMQKMKLLIADDHEMIRRGVRSILSSQKNIQIVGEATTGLQVIEQVDRLKPNVIIMDLMMPVLDGIEATRQIHRKNPDVRIIVLTIHNSEVIVRRVLDAGAHGYLLKSDLANQLKTAVNTVCSGRQYLSQGIEEDLSNRTLQNQRPDMRDVVLKLTSRETEVARLLATGKSSKEIASNLEISVRTVETHRANSMRKLGVHSVTELLHLISKNELLSL